MSHFQPRYYTRDNKTGGVPSMDAVDITNAHKAGDSAPVVAVVTRTLTASHGSEDGTGRGVPLVTVGFNARQDPDHWQDRTGPLNTDGCTQAVAFSAKDYGGDAISNLSPTLRAGGHNTSHANAGVMPAVVQAMQVRRLTPVECERLQGFPDEFTALDASGKPMADGPRYRMLGNAVAVPVAEWIGRKIMTHEEKGR